MRVLAFTSSNHFDFNFYFIFLYRAAVRAV